MVLKVSVVGKVPCGVGDKLQWDTHSETPGFTSKAMFSAAENYASTNKTKIYGAPSDHAARTAHCELGLVRPSKL